MSFNSLRARLTALVILFCILIAAIFTLAVHYAHGAYYDELRQRQGLVFAHSVVAMYPDLIKLESIDRDEVESRFKLMLRFESSSAIYLIDNQGRVRAGYTKQGFIGKKGMVSLKPIEALMQAPMGKAIFGDDPDFPGEKCLFAAAPLSDTQNMSGYLYMLIRPQEAEPLRILASSYANRTALLVALSASVLSAIFVLAAMGLITRPLSRLTEAADKVREEKIEDELDPTAFPYHDRNDEIGHLSRAFRDMVQRLHQQIQRVRRMDATRRDWVASISHDLRTPLTSLTGHLETVIMHGNRMDAVERDRFLRIALKNAQHLDRLSASLFDFARLDSEEVRLEKVPSHIGELVDDIVLRFAPAAEARHVHIENVYPDALPLILIDAALIERALANLMDNALRYTPPGGIIGLSVHKEPDGILIAITDTGRGIAPADMPLVFDRFFQGTVHREGRGHAGLGLAIVKRVAQLHNGRVHAENRPEGGARFTLWLPLNEANVPRRTIVM